MSIRRVVTGHNKDGKAIVASDMEVDPITITGMGGTVRLWGADETPTFPDEGKPYPMPDFFPPAGGFRFGLITIPPEPDNPDDFDIEITIKELREKIPSLLFVLEQSSEGMHASNTIDFEYVLSGEVWLELDDGVQVHLRPGDTVVQNGTRHRWVNKGSEPCQMVLCMVGANRL